MTDIELIGIEPNSGPYTCTKFTLRFKGKIYTAEEWFSDNSAGLEFYDEAGTNCVNSSGPDEVTDWDPSDDMRVAKYWGRYQAEVVPLMEKIAKEVLGSG